MTINRFQNIIEKFLLYLAFAIAACHTFLAAFRYILPYKQVAPYEQWAAVALIAVAFLYALVSILASASSRKRILSFIRRIMTFEQIMLCIIFLLFIVSCYVNGRDMRVPTVYFWVEDWDLFDVFICFFLLFPFIKIFGREKAEKSLELLIHLVVITYSVFSAVCLWRILHNEVLTFPSGEQAGMTINYALMLGKHYNLTGMIAATMLCLCVYMAFSKERYLQILYAVLGLVQLLIVYLCNSRTVFVGVLVFAIFLAFSLSWRHFQNRKVYQRLLLSFLSAAIIGGIFWVGRDAVFAIFESITHFSEEIAAEKASNLASTVRNYFPVPLTTTPQISYQPALLASSGDGAVRELTDLSMRANIWTSALRVMVSSPRAFFFGFTPYGVTAALKDIGGYWSEAAHCHNTVLQIGVSLGVPAMAMYIVFLFSVAAKCLHLVFSSQIHVGKEQIIIPATILCFTAINMAEAYIFANFTVMACFFYLFCGWTTDADERPVYLKPPKIRLWVTRLMIFFLVIALTVLSGRYFSGMISQDESNLLLGTNHGLYNYHMAQKGFDAKMGRDGEGIKVTMKAHDENGWCVLLFDDGRAREILSGPLGDVYTLSFEAKSNISNADIRVSSRQGDGKSVQIDFGTAKLTTADEWECISLTGTLRGVAATSQGLYFNLKNNPAGTEISIRNLKLVKIDVLHDPTNILYGTNLGKTNFSLMDNGFNASLEEDGVGVKVTSTTRDDSGWLVLFFSDGNSCNVLSGPEGESYTLSFEARSNIPNAEIRVSSSQSDHKQTQVDFGKAILDQEDEWIEVTMVGSLNGVEATTQGIYFDLRYNQANTEISIRNLKLSKSTP